MTTKKEKDSVLFIVTGKDTNNESFEFEEPTMARAMEIYYALKGAKDILSLMVLEYNFNNGQYHLVLPND